MKRFLVIATEDYYSGGPSFSHDGFVGDFDTLDAARAAIPEEYTGLCSMVEILDQELRQVYVIIEDKEKICDLS